jgi:asparagine synthase (glutamine-hydrolysing)
MLRTTPDPLHEAMPLVSSDGVLVLTADARIDNREDLISSLGVPGAAGEATTDNRLILAAYEEWGECCPETLVGDFAFAIWDSREGSVFCARDHFGIRPFYYFLTDRLFAFGSEIKALLSLPEVPRELNELRIGYHLAGTVEDKEMTFFEGIRRLLPGHSLKVSRAATHRRRYWDPSPSRELRLGSDGAYAEAFRELFVESVRCRLRGSAAIGSALSGGLDSSAVTCVARDLLSRDSTRPLSTFSAVFDEFSECDERAYAAEILRLGRLQAHQVRVDELDPFADLGRVLSHTDEPFSVPTYFILWNLFRAARDADIRVLLDGLDGDTAVHHGLGRLAELAAAGQWAVFAGEARAISKHENLPSVAFMIKRYGVPQLTRLAKGFRWGRFVRETAAFGRQFGIGHRQALWHCGPAPLLLDPMRSAWRSLHNPGRVQEGGNTIISRPFARRISLHEHLRSGTKLRAAAPRTSREEHVRFLESGLIPYAFEFADKASMAFSIDSRHPFADRRLIDFCVALPPEQKLQQGWVRMILRRALEGVVPENIRWRGGKTSNSAAVTAGILRFGGTVLEELLVRNPDSLRRFVDTQKLKETFQRYLMRNNPVDEMVIWNSAILAFWLRETGFRE